MPLEGNPTMTDPTPAPGAPTDPAPTNTPTTTPLTGPDPTDPVDVASLPTNVQHLISDLRKQAGSARTQARSQAAENARNEVLQQIGEALGLTESVSDPKALADQLSTTQQAVANAQLELDVYKRASGMGVNAGKLLDSMSFRDAVDGLPDEGFEQALEQLINQWADKDPSLRGGAPATTGRRPVENLRSGALPASGSGAFDADSWIRHQAGR